MAAPIEIGLGRVLAATGGLAVARGAERFSAAVIDGRAVAPGALFFAVKGERHDGHDFAGQAVQAGAAGVVVARGRARGLRGVEGATVVEVDDPVQALGRLAQAHRAAMTDLKVVAVTGSNGKTTTKDMLASIFAAALGAASVLKTEGNLNNHLGVPLTLLRLTADHRVAVVELGMSALGEIAYLAGLARPDVGVVVSLAAVHLEHLGSLENIARAKGEIWGGLAGDGVAVLPVDEPLLEPHVAHVSEARRLTFGPRARGPAVGFEDVTADREGLAFRLCLRGVTSHTGLAARVPLVGAHHASNAAAAAAAAHALGVGAGSILDGLAQVQPGKHRGQLRRWGEVTLLDDCYNASPLSMRAALDALAAITPAGARRIAVLGDMRELGPESPRLHGEVGGYAAGRVDALVGVGDEARHLAEAARAAGVKEVVHTDDVSAAAARVRAWARPGDVVLVKASRGVKLERVIDALTAEPG